MGVGRGAALWTGEPAAPGAGVRRLRSPVLELRSGGPLEVHHVNGDPTDNRIANTIPICRDCHHKATYPGI